MIDTKRIYRLEANCGGTWEPVPDSCYTCYPGEFRALLEMLDPTPGQRVRRVSDDCTDYDGI